MHHRRKLNLEKVGVSLITVCPFCGAAIPPEDQNRVDSQRMKCPQCGKTSRMAHAPAGGPLLTDCAQVH